MPESSEKREKAIGFLRKLFSFSGRSTVKQYWLTILELFGIQVALCILLALGFALFKDSPMAFLWSILVGLLYLASVVAAYANLFRRLHDLGLSGWWALYLSLFGLPAIFCSYAMDADNSVSTLVERIKALGHIWGWILAMLFWPVGGLFGFLMISFARSQEGDNAYGKDPHAPPEPAAVPEA